MIAIAIVSAIVMAAEIQSPLWSQKVWSIQREFAIGARVSCVRTLRRRKKEWGAAGDCCALDQNAHHAACQTANRRTRPRAVGRNGDTGTPGATLGASCACSG